MVFFSLFSSLLKGKKSTFPTPDTSNNGEKGEKSSNGEDKNDDGNQEFVSQYYSTIGKRKGKSPNLSGKQNGMSEVLKLKEKVQQRKQKSKLKHKTQEKGKGSDTQKKSSIPEERGEYGEHGEHGDEIFPTALGLHPSSGTEDSQSQSVSSVSTSTSTFQTHPLCERNSGLGQQQIFTSFDRISEDGEKSTSSEANGKGNMNDDGTVRSTDANIDAPDDATTNPTDTTAAIVTEDQNKSAVENENDEYINDDDDDDENNPEDEAFLRVSIGSLCIQGISKIKSGNPNEDRIVVKKELQDELQHAQVGQRNATSSWLSFVSGPKSRSSSAGSRKTKKLNKDFSSSPLEDIALPVRLACVFDGHGGTDCVQYMADVLPVLIMSNPNFKSFHNARQVLHESFVEAEAQYRALKPKRKLKDGGRGGTCAIVAMSHGASLCIANLGDCRAVLSRSEGTYEVLTVDHRASNHTEAARIKKAGGFIEDARVQGILEPSRTLGDIEVKDSCPPGVISCFPEITAVSLDPKVASKRNGSGVSHPSTFSIFSSAVSSSSESSMGTAISGTTFTSSKSSKYTCGVVLILGTDGLWDGISNKEAARIARNVIRSCNDTSRAAKILCDMAQKKSIDDISCVVMHWPQASVIQQLC